MNEIHNPTIHTSNLLDAYSKDPMIRDRLNSRGIYIDFQEETIAVKLYLTTEVFEASAYVELMEILSVLAPEDTIVIFIDSPGGYLDGAEMIIAAIRASQAYSLAMVTGSAASAATIIALACDDLQMRPMAYFMQHAASFGSAPSKLHEQQSFMEFQIGHTKRYLRECYKYFMTAEEIEALIKGKDFYFDKEETLRRFALVVQAREEIRQKEYEATIRKRIETLTESLSSLKEQLPDEPKVSVKKTRVTK